MWNKKEQSTHNKNTELDTLRLYTTSISHAYPIIVNNTLR